MHTWGVFSFRAMTRKSYDKTPLTFEQQLDLLESRELIITDRERALNYLKEISYYRLSAYFLPYQSLKDMFNEGITFNIIIETYSFDRELRLLIFDCIERIEVAVRTQMIYNMAMYYNDSHWQDNRYLFVAPYINKIGIRVDPYDDLQKIIAKAKCARTPEVFIKHYVEKYGSPLNPPSWMCLELLTVGELSHLYNGLKFNADKKRIADFFNLHFTVFTSWLHTLAYIRNLCAHHSRLWNRELAIVPDKLQKPSGAWISEQFNNNRRLFYFICCLRYLLLRANPTNHLKEKLYSLFLKYPDVPIGYLGIPSDGKGNLLPWYNERIWK